MGGGEGERGRLVSVREAGVLHSRNRENKYKLALYIDTRTQTYAHARMHTRTHACTHIRVCRNAHTYTHTDAHTHTHMHTRTHTHPNASPFTGACWITFFRLTGLITGSSPSLSPLLHELELAVGRGSAEEEVEVCDLGRTICGGATYKRERGE